MYNAILIAGVIILLVMSFYINDLRIRMTVAEKQVYHFPAEVPYTLLTDSAHTPTKATDNSAGYDLYADEYCAVPAHGRKLVKTGVAFAIPHGYYGINTGRSGLTIKRGIIGQIGIIDSDYRGEVGVMMFNTTDTDYAVNRGERIAQIVFTPYLRSELVYTASLDDTERGAGGFGHSGK